MIKFIKLLTANSFGCYISAVLLACIIMFIGQSTLDYKLHLEKNSFSLARKAEKFDRFLSNFLESNEYKLKILSDKISNNSQTENLPVMQKVLKEFANQSYSNWGIKWINPNSKQTVTQYGISNNYTFDEESFKKILTTHAPFQFLSNKDELWLVHYINSTKTDLGWLLIPIEYNTLKEIIDIYGFQHSLIKFKNSNVSLFNLVLNNQFDLKFLEKNFLSHSVNSKKTIFTVFENKISYWEYLKLSKLSFIYLLILTLLTIIIGYYYKNYILHKSNADLKNNLEENSLSKLKLQQNFDELSNAFQALHTKKEILENNDIQIKKFFNEFSLSLFSTIHTVKTWLGEHFESEQNVKHLIERIANLIPFSKPEKLNLISVIQESIDLYKYESHTDKIEIFLHHSQEEITIVEEGFLLKKFFSSMIGNLLKGIKENGKLEVYLDKSADNVVIIFKDDGYGYSDQLLNQEYLSPHNNISFKLMHWRLIKEIANQKNFIIENSFQKGMGTKIVLTIPINTNMQIDTKKKKNVYNLF